MTMLSLLLLYLSLNRLPGEQMLSFVIGGIDTPPRIFRKVKIFLSTLSSLSYFVALDQEKALLEPLKVPGIVNLPNG